MKRSILLCAAILSTAAAAQSKSALPEVDSVYTDAHSLYLDLHQHPELSSHETRTAAELAAKLRILGYEVMEHVGGTGIVALLKNGAGPTVMLRTELDALPVEEMTGLSYSSKIIAKDDAGHDVHVMHACGHDLHMSSLYGASEIMAHSKDSWRGTLFLIAQPSEELLSGAKRMVDDGLFTRFAKPDYGVALHVSNSLPARKVGVTPGYSYSNADALLVTIYGRGGHGSAPQTTIDPVLIAAKTVVALQSIVSREIKPGDPAVITVGYLQAGTKNNIIPDEARLGITVRSYTAEVRTHLLRSIDRVVKAEAEGAGAERLPLIQHLEATDAVYNDPELAHHLHETLVSALGKDNVVKLDPIMASEDYSVFIKKGIPSFYFSLGGANPQKWAENKAKGVIMPSNHSSLFAPDVEPSLRTGINAEVIVLRELFNSKPSVSVSPKVAAETFLSE